MHLCLSLYTEEGKRKLAREKMEAMENAQRAEKELENAHKAHQEADADNAAEIAKAKEAIERAKKEAEKAKQEFEKRVKESKQNAIEENKKAVVVTSSFPGLNTKLKIFFSLNSQKVGRSGNNSPSYFLVQTLTFVETVQCYTGYDCGSSAIGLNLK